MSNCQEIKSKATFRCLYSSGFHIQQYLFGHFLVVVNASFLALPYSFSITPFSLLSYLFHSVQFKTPFPSNPSVSISNIDYFLIFLCGFFELFAMVSG